MKPFRIEFLAALAVLFALCALSLAADAAPPASNDYFDAVVILIDPKTGDLGVTVEDEKTGKPLRLAFKVDPDAVYVSNPLNQSLDFSDIQVGDHLNIYTERDAQGREVPTDIYDSNRYE